MQNIFQVEISNIFVTAIEDELMKSNLQVALADEDVVNYVDGIGLHWYLNNVIPTEFLNFASNNVANSTKVLFKLATESSNGMQDVVTLMVD